ncbi:unnamed protein product [Penicillium salamii]|nr:unnamed protein product [Penicillium salamii]
MSALHARGHKRVYQACEPCREKKVRCELGSADYPSAPPCARCCRERKECFFAESRIRRTASTKRKASSPPQGGVGRPAPDLRGTPLPRTNSRVLEDRQRFPGDGRAAAALLEGHPRTYHDALTLLSEACEHREIRKGGNDGSAPISSDPDFRHASAHSPPPNNVSVDNNRTETQNALQAWSRVRFVRGGLFTAEEALDMVDYFYRFQSAFSPVVPECFREHSHHAALIEEEPILTITILMIGSRYRKWTGPAAVARSYIVHDRIWRYLQQMISRLFWSDDLFVGEFSSHRPGYTDSWSHGFRTLGTCEALLLLLDWHPRALHFPPPDEDTSSIVLPEPKRPRTTSSRTANHGAGSGHDWLARSDRLCYSMLSNVLMLATEIGIFNETTSSQAEDHHDQFSTARDRERFHRIQCLIWVYATQQPGRPGQKIPIQCAPVRVPGVKNDDATECWMRVANIMNKVNDLLFLSPKYTSDIIRNGRYLQVLRDVQPLLNESNVQFDHAKLARQTRCILTIEYDYAQLCIFSLALQAVINRNRRDDISGRLESCPEDTSLEEKSHLSATVKAARAILKVVLDDLLPQGSLTYIPVRSYSRILGATLILLKCCAAGIREVEIPSALDQVLQVAAGLRSSAVDDTHLSARWGDLIESLAHRLRSRLAQPVSPKAQSMGLQLSALGLGNNTAASQQCDQYHPLTTYSASQGLPARSDVEDHTQFDVWSMWWDDQFSQANLNFMPWYPTLGLVEGSDPALSNDHSVGGILGGSGSLY